VKRAATKVCDPGSGGAGVQGRAIRGIFNRPIHQEYTIKPLPESEAALVVRTDFSDERGWQAIRSRIQSPFRLFRPEVLFVEDREYEGVGVDELLRLFPDHSRHSFVALADRAAMSPPDHALLLVNLNPYEEPRGATFRAVPSQLGGIATNLSLGNMDFREFAESVGAEGVFRGFRWG
jgi:hypothetical protein